MVEISLPQFRRGDTSLELKCSSEPCHVGGIDTLLVREEYSTDAHEYAWELWGRNPECVCSP